MYDCESSLIMKDKSHLGLLYIKINRKGEWVVGNLAYLEKILESGVELDADYYDFQKEPLPKLKEIGYENEWFFTSFKSFIKDNKTKLFEKI